MRITLLITSLLYMNSLFAQAVSDSVWVSPVTGDKMHKDVLGENDKLVELKKRPWRGLGEALAINAAILSWDYFLFDRDWARVSKDVIKTNLTDGWVWDDDSFSGNEFSHPYHGSLFYNAARENGMSYGMSLLYPIVGSATWELFCENNRPAINDIFATGIGGSAIGEATHRASDIAFDNTKRGAARVVRELAGTLLNPVRGLKRAFNGDMFRVSHTSKGKEIDFEPYHFEIGLGDRWIAELGKPHPDYDRKYYQNIPVLDFTLDYGDHFNKIDGGGKSHPFDKFEIYAMLNLWSKNPTFGILDISGRIASKQYSTKSGWDLDWGFYQNYKYIDNYWKNGEMRAGNLPLVSEAASFGGGLFAQKEGEHTTLCNLIQLNAVPMGCSTADYFSSPKNFGVDALPTGEQIGKRRYNFGLGYSLREEFTLHIHQKVTVGDRFYMLQLYMLNGYNPKNVVGHHNSVMGDKGSQTTLMNTFYTHVRLSQNIKLKLEYLYYTRIGKYDYYPNYTGRSHEVKTTLAYSI